MKIKKHRYLYLPNCKIFLIEQFLSSKPCLKYKTFNTSQIVKYLIGSNTFFNLIYKIYILFKCKNYIVLLLDSQR